MTTPTDRIATLDTIRGVAVLGILAMNIVGFGLPDVAYLNPAAMGGHTGNDLVAWAIAFVLVDGKMRGLFSFLFGASMLLVIDRAEARGESAARVHLARMGWLFVFGLAHLYLIWWGDILNLYALVGAFALLFRRQAPHQQVATGLVLLLFTAAVTAQIPWGLLQAQRAGSGGHAAAEAARQLADDAANFGVPGERVLRPIVNAYRGGYARILSYRWTNERDAVLTGLVFNGPETLAYMLFGMAGLRSGFLTGAWSRDRYRRLALVCFGVGIPAYAACAAYVALHGFELLTVGIGVLAVPVLLRPVMIVGWAALIALLMQPDGALTNRFAAAGRMALSNYLLTSLICTTIFYGYGFGLFARLSRAELYLVVAPIWAGMLLWSPWWLARFRYGPIEWLWRSLARGRVQSMSVSA